MINSFFFIPGNHPKLNVKIETVKADYIIVDLEDAVFNSDISFLYDSLASVKNKSELYIRIRLFLKPEVSVDELERCIELGFRNFVIPKYETLEDLKMIERVIEKRKVNCKIILLVENPKALVFLQDVLETTSLNVIGIGFGSHDYSLISGIKHDKYYLDFPRFQIATIAKAFNKISIDIASMEINDTDQFLNELKSAYDFGFDGKFIIHPKQLTLLDNFNYHSESELSLAYEILAEYKKKEFPSVFVFKGKTIEQPHIKYYKKILNFKNTNENK